MSGLRIHHPTERNVVLLVPIPAKRPDLGGIPKDVYVHLNDMGDALVSAGVWNELMISKESGLSAHEFVILNEVANPPTLVMGPDVKPMTTKRAMRETPDGIYDAKLQAIAQQFAPHGIGVQITTHKKGEK